MIPPRASPSLLQLSSAQLAREVQHLPSAPKVLPQLKRLLHQGAGSMPEIVALIRLDAPIAARVLQVANNLSPCPSESCRTVEEAVRRLGPKTVFDLVSYAVASQVLVRPLEIYGVKTEELWRQSVACALAAEYLARLTGDDDGAAYTMGLLHRIGMIAINEWALRRHSQCRLADHGFPGEFAADERAVLGVTQAEVGAEMLRLWRFPPQISDPLGRQYDDARALRLTRMTSLLYAARWIRATVCDEERNAVPGPGVLASLPLRSVHLLMVAKEVRARLEAMEAMLQERDPEPLGFLRITSPGQAHSAVFEPRAWDAETPWLPLPALG